MGYASPTQFTFGVGDIARRLGQEVRASGRYTSDKWRIAYIAGLIERHGFPEPLPFPGAAAGEIKSRSRWIRSSVDRWFEDRDPAGAAHADAAAMREAASDMDARAADLGRAVRAGREAIAAGHNLRVIVGGAA